MPRASNNNQVSRRVQQVAESKNSKSCNKVNNGYNLSKCKYQCHQPEITCVVS